MAQAKTSRVVQAEQVRSTYTHFVDAGTPYDTLFEPAYWAHVVAERKIIPYDIFEILPDEGTYLALLRVIEVDLHSVRMVQVDYVDLTKAKKSAPLNADATLYVEWSNAQTKFRVVRPPKKPGDAMAVMQDGFHDQESAHAWLMANRKRLAA